MILLKDRLININKILSADYAEFSYGGKEKEKSLEIIMENGSTRSIPVESKEEALKLMREIEKRFKELTITQSSII